MFTFLLIVQTIVAIAMITLILMQRSEGGGLAGGGSPSGMMSARGAADFLTRSTAILSVVFVSLSIVLAGLAAGRGAPRQYETAPAAPAAPAGPATAPSQIPGTAPIPGTAAPAPAPAPQQPATNGAR